MWLEACVAVRRGAGVARALRLTASTWIVPGMVVGLRSTFPPCYTSDSEKSILFAPS